MENQNKESIFGRAKRDPKFRKKLIIGCAIFIVIMIIGKINGPASGSSGTSSSSNSQGEHTCSYCGNKYSGNGYHHIGSNCEMASNGWEKYDNKCSMKCCEEAWNNGKH